MIPAPVIPDTAPFTPEQRAWLNGFVAGVFARGAASVDAAPRAETLKPLTILFGSQTGTGEGLAKRAAKIAGQRGFAATVLDMAQASAAKLAHEPSLLVIASTHGDGEPPDNARALHAALRDPAAGRLPAVRFSVCGLGDTNYVRFCQAAKDFDETLEKLGAQRITPRQDCDVDYEKGFLNWLDASLAALGSPAPVLESPSASEVHLAGFSRKNPFPATVRVSRILNGEGSEKQVQHVEFSLEGSGLSYEAGDALGVFPQNCPELIAEILTRLGCDGEEAVVLPSGVSTSFRLALSNHCDLGKPTAELAARFAAPVLDAGHGLGGTQTLHVVDLIAARPETRLVPAELVRLLRPLSPRLYSISSSPAAHTGAVHLTVAAVRYEAHGRKRKGACSTFLSDRVVENESTAAVYVHSNPSFRPPPDDAPMIMVGPGTGIAPFRGFLHERRARRATGRSWLFFGDQRCATDFLYSSEIAELQREGVLTRIDTAFSRDQEAKVYVQHRMLENAGELYAWLEAGAYFYVCGDAARMAKDVESALLQVVAQGSGGTAQQAADYVQAMRAAKRYRRDVY